MSRIPLSERDSIADMHHVIHSIFLPLECRKVVADKPSKPNELIGLNTALRLCLKNL